MPVREAETEDERLLDEAMPYFWAAERFGWTPDQVDKCPQWLFARLPTVAAVHDEVVAEKQRAAAKKAAA